MRRKRINTTSLAFGKRILILIPHPDDEVVACCASIVHARKAGSQLFGLYLTNGCIARQTLWPWQRKNYEKYVIRRMHEAIDVAQHLGVTVAGFSDRPARHLWRNMGDVYDQIAAAIKTHDIDQIWVPAYEGGNADHDGLNGLVSHFRNVVSILEFAEYNFAGSKAHANIFPYADGSEITLTLTNDETAFKKKMLSLYKSEQKNLGYVKTVQECYRPLAEYDYTIPPHAGTLWYARFQWVPFQHPRVDFTKPEEVCAALNSFSPSTTVPLAPAKQ